MDEMEETAGRRAGTAAPDAEKKVTNTHVVLVIVTDVKICQSYMGAHYNYNFATTVLYCIVLSY